MSSASGGQGVALDPPKAAGLWKPVPFGGLWGLLGVLMLLLSPAMAEDFRVYDIEIVQPWTRQPNPDEAAMAVYLGLANTGNLPDRLVRATTPLAAKVAVVSPPEVPGGRARHSAGVALAPGEAVDFRPGASYLHLSGLRQRPAEGNRFPMILQFQRSGTIEITVSVVGPWADDVLGEDGREAPAPRR